MTAEFRHPCLQVRPVGESDWYIVGKAFNPERPPGEMYLPDIVTMQNFLTELVVHGSDFPEEPMEVQIGYYSETELSGMLEFDGW